MKINKILIAVFLTAVICIPGLIALSYYNHAQANPITQQAVSKLTITAPDGTEYPYKKGDKCPEPSLGEDLIAYFVGLNERAVFVSELPELATAENRYQVTYTSYNRDTTYYYYFTTESEYAYLVDHKKTVYRIDETDAIAFLKSRYSLCLYTSSAVPVFTVGQTVITPETMLWQYACYDNEYREVSVETTDIVSTLTVRGALSLQFDDRPDFINVKIVSGNVSLYDGQPESIPSTLFRNPASYSITVQAKWFRDEKDSSSFGEATYRFDTTVKAPAVFYLSTAEIDPGEFVIISAKNVEDPSKVTFTSDPVIHYTPVFFSDGEYVRALVPINTFAIEEMPTQFSFRLSYEGTEQTMQLNVNEKTFKSTSYDASEALIKSNRSEQAFKEFDNALGAILKTGTAERYFDNSLFVNPAGDAKIRTGFGLYRTLTATGDVYRHEGVDYLLYGKNNGAYAAMNGKVVYVGNLSLTGRVVVIDHGFGLHSLYAHLESYSVEVGMLIEKGAQIGVCGATGFTTSTNLHFGLYVYDVPVSPYDVMDNGAQMTDFKESSNE